MSEDWLQAPAEASRLEPARCQALCQLLPHADGLDTAMRIVDRMRQALVGVGLLTVNLNLGVGEGEGEGGGGEGAETITLQRIWSSNPEAYPVAGRKTKAMTPWTRQLLCAAQVFVGEGEAALRAAFDDHARIAALGLRAVVNVPLVDEAGRCFATFNVLGSRERWQEAEVMGLCMLGAMATPVVRRAVDAVARS